MAVLSALDDAGLTVERRKSRKKARIESSETSSPKTKKEADANDSVILIDD